ncbi:MAG: IS110 family transposase [Acidobacteriaceae bacterium]|nr:IS110 family transposase [Acidobacteriaceae bacterium]
MMTPFCYFVGLDVHRKSISYCVKRPDGSIVREGRIEAQRPALDSWALGLKEPWCGGLEATICSHWIYEHLKPYAACLQMAAPAKLKAIAAAKRKNDRLDARVLADLLRCDMFPSCYVAPAEYQLLRRQLRERAFLVRTEVMFKNKIAGLLIESGVPYETRLLHGKRYFAELLQQRAALIDEIRPLLAFNRTQVEGLREMDRLIVKQLLQHPLLRERVARLQIIAGVGEITSLTWAVETGQPERFPNEAHAISYCGLCAAQCESAGVQKRGPISKQRNRFLQTTLIEAAHFAVQHNQQLRAVYEAAQQKGHRQRAILEVARRLVRYLLAVDRQYFAAASMAAA